VDGRRLVERLGGVVVERLVVRDAGGHGLSSVVVC
jgi:hypothetical protein